MPARLPLLRLRLRQLSTTVLSLSLALVPVTAAQASDSGSDPSAIKPATNINELYDNSTAKLLLAPATIKPSNGKFPSSQPLELHIKGCDPSKTTVAGANLKSSTVGTKFVNSNFTVNILAPGITLSGEPVVTECELTMQVKITSDQLIPGSYHVSVTRNATDQDSTWYVGYAILTVLDSNAGNIPADASVDAIWSVMGNDLCKRNFGRIVNNKTYCIEVKVGNNSGYPLQLAGIGFKRNLGGTVDYNGNLAYRAVRGASQSQDLGWNMPTVINSATGLGILMASFNPFFKATWNVARWSAGTTVVGTALPKALNTVWQDPSQRQMNNLDDEAFRDNVTIPNNTQIRTTIFVDRTLFYASGVKTLMDACARIYGPDATTTDKKKLCDADNTKLLAKAENDPTLVKAALGDLVIVGQFIDYIQRVVVDKSALAAAVGSIQQQSAPLSHPTLVPFSGDKNKLLAGDTGITSITVTLAAKADIPSILYLYDKDGKLVSDKDGAALTLTPAPAKVADSKVTYQAPSSIPAGVYTLRRQDGSLLTQPGDVLTISASDSAKTDEVQPANNKPAPSRTEPSGSPKPSKKTPTSPPHK